VGQTTRALTADAAPGPPSAAPTLAGDATLAARLERALDENRDLTEQLRRSQKIGALGRLAGGVAHDFNNLLQVIGGYADALGAVQMRRSERRRLARRIRRTTDRAAALTRQLLAFGRRQLLVPEVLDLNVTVLSLERMLTRVLGEDVHLASDLAGDLRAVKVDPGQIEQVLLNLAINARDAMPDGGALAIATANETFTTPFGHPALPVLVPPGSWVRLTVHDTGCGMDADTVAQAFEPFFTTKDASRGSGLGLSMVYGIVKQSGGYTWIESAPSAGTAVHVLLPSIDAVVEPRKRRPAALPTPAPHPAGTVLLVEDNADVRALFAAFLRQAGFAVIEAADGRDALERFDSQAAAIDVVVTDVVMPNMSGPALASALRTRRPELKVIFVSGYADELDLERGSPSRPAVLHKPVTRSALVRKVSAVMAGAAAARPAERQDQGRR
jgi:two-component system cell cycle sensor histidine kinase/response regulator CckA